MEKSQWIWSENNLTSLSVMETLMHGFISPEVIRKPDVKVWDVRVMSQKIKPLL